MNLNHLFLLTLAFLFSMNGADLKARCGNIEYTYMYNYVYSYIYIYVYRLLVYKKGLIVIFHTTV